IRLERARRSRLGAGAASSQTLWRDILKPSFFNRALGGGPDGTLLFWPVESEEWSSEALRARVRASGCAAAPGPGKPAEMELASEKLMLDLGRDAAPDPALRPAAARLAYHRGVLLARAGQSEAAKQAAALVTPPELLGPELAKYARLLRLELGV